MSIDRLRFKSASRSKSCPVFTHFATLTPSDLRIDCREAPAYATFLSNETYTYSGPSAYDRNRTPFPRYSPKPSHLSPVTSIELPAPTVGHSRWSVIPDIRTQLPTAFEFSVVDSTDVSPLTPLGSARELNGTLAGKQRQRRSLQVMTTASKSSTSTSNAYKTDVDTGRTSGAGYPQKIEAVGKNSVSKLSSSGEGLPYPIHDVFPAFPDGFDSDTWLNQAKPGPNVTPESSKRHQIKSAGQTSPKIGVLPGWQLTTREHQDAQKMILTEEAVRRRRH